MEYSDRRYFHLSVNLPFDPQQQTDNFKIINAEKKLTRQSEQKKLQHEDTPGPENLSLRKSPKISSEVNAQPCLRTIDPDFLKQDYCSSNFMYDIQ
ncbi:hypothetical protein TSAR_004403 [Trichomalopsis sarcophagae]|uniref:Uncharacterized protein n=1 Tax=Trichomalopsis sarcophagae TaxID=543379 RepID=A0A232EW82_9HYME|nr:hypothetical protein TSAR_004403 [Trichomalopsis sarcophagae]